MDVKMISAYFVGGARSNVVGIICPPLVGIGLTELPNAPLLTTTTHIV